MSAHHQVFVRTLKTASRLVSDVSVAAGCELAAVGAGRGPVAFGGRAGPCVVEVELGHDFADDLGVALSAYSTVPTVRVSCGERCREQAAAQQIFDGRAHIGGYDLLRVFYLQALLGRCDTVAGAVR